MDLIDRYLVAVRRHLPPPLQKDIVEELADSLRSEAEDKARQAGRPLTGADQAELLRQRGHPWLMASRYLPQQQLIGPALYPYYRRALTMVVFWVVLPVTLIGGALAAIFADDSTHTWLRAMNTAWHGAIYSVGIVTIVFAVLENQRVRITALDNWDPARLPAPQDGRAIPRTDTIFSLVFTIAFVMVWTDLVRLPDVASYNGMPIRFTADAVWASIYVPVLITMLVSIATSFVDLMRPWRTRLFSAIQIANNLFAIGILAVTLRAGHWATITAPPEAADQAARAERWINVSIEWTLVIIAAVTAFEIAWELWQLSKSRREAQV